MNFFRASVKSVKQLAKVELYDGGGVTFDSESTR